MSLYELPNETVGLDNIAVELTGEIPSFIPLFLVFVYMVIFLGGIGRQKMRVGTSDYAMWSTVAGIGTLLIALILSLSSGMMNYEWLVLVLVITILSGVWLFLSKRQSEV